MISDSDVHLERSILSCPFSQKCILPKNENLCHFPDYKICPDYCSKLKKIKTSKKVLY